jgi:hypothetical protein
MWQENMPNIDDIVRFLPSRVDGIPHVQEVCISREALEIVADGKRHVFPFLSFARGREIYSGRVPVGELHFSKSRYTDSHVIFYTTPQITVFMPNNSPTEYPDSHFWKIQEILSAGGLKLYDDGPPKHPPAVLHPRPFRTFAYLVLILALAWLHPLAGTLPEPAGSAWRGFLFSNPHNPAIGLSFMLPKTAVPLLLAFRHARSKTSVAIIIAASYLIAFVSSWALYNTIRSWREFELLGFDAHFWTTWHSLSGFIIVTMCALVGWSWRRGFLEPIRPNRDTSSSTSE